MNDCKFCEIVESLNLPICDLYSEDIQQPVPCSVIYKDSFVVAFLDTKPITPGHTLIIPATHVKSLTDLGGYEGAELFRQSVNVSNALKKLPGVVGVNFWLADGKEAGQNTNHLIMHVIPRYPDDGFRLKLPYCATPSQTELEDKANQIKAVWY